MAADKKLYALRKSYEVQEGDAVDEYKRIEKVYDERRERLENVQRELEQIEERIGELKGKQRSRAFAQSGGATLESLSVFRERLEKEKEPIAGRLVAAQKEVDSAARRLQAANEELLEIRIELKKLDKILEGRATRSQIKDAAREEIVTEEMNYFRRRK